jgi:hypothetical protein
MLIGLLAVVEKFPKDNGAVSNHGKKFYEMHGYFTTDVL